MESHWTEGSKIRQNGPTFHTVNAQTNYSQPKREGIPNDAQKRHAVPKEHGTAKYGDPRSVTMTELLGRKLHCEPVTKRASPLNSPTNFAESRGSKMKEVVTDDRTDQTPLKQHHATKEGQIMHPLVPSPRVTKVVTTPNGLSRVSDKVKLCHLVSRLIVSLRDTSSSVQIVRVMARETRSTSV